MKKIVVTGGNGKTGRWVVQEFLNHGYEVVNVDVNVTPQTAGNAIKVDLTDLGQVFNALTGADAVVHIAAIPRPRATRVKWYFKTMYYQPIIFLKLQLDLELRKL